MDIDWSAHLAECLDSTFYCALATSGPDGPWVNPVYFSYGTDRSLLFISLPTSRHMHNIEVNPDVAMAIYSTDQPPGQHVRSLQLERHATRVPDTQVAEACAEYFARPGAAKAIGVEQPDPASYQGQDADTWKFIRVVPTSLWYFNSEHFGEHRVPVPAEFWRPRS